MSDSASIKIDVEAECFCAKCGEVLDIQVYPDAWNAGLKIDVLPCICTQTDEEDES